MTSSQGDTLFGGVVQILDPIDSALIQFVSVDRRGFFEVDELESKEYLLVVEFLGQNSFQQEFKACKELSMDIVMSPKINTIDEIEILAKDLGIRIQGDTTTYVVEKFASGQETNLEELMEKLPGFTVENSAIKYKGENVKNVYVDNKDLLSDKQKIALEDLDPEIFDEIEVFSRQSDFNATGQEKDIILNLKLRASKKNIWVGGYDAGGGIKFSGAAHALKSDKSLGQILVLKANNTGGRLITFNDYSNLQTDFSYLNALNGKAGNVENILPEILQPPNNSKQAYDQVSSYTLDKSIPKGKTKLAVLGLVGFRMTSSKNTRIYNDGTLLYGKEDVKSRLSFAQVVYLKEFGNFRITSSVRNETNVTEGGVNYSSTDFEGISEQSSTIKRTNIQQSLQYKKHLSNKVLFKSHTLLNLNVRRDEFKFLDIDLPRFFQNQNSTLYGGSQRFQFDYQVSKSTILRWDVNTSVRKHNLNIKSDLAQNQTSGNQSEQVETWGSIFEQKSSWGKWEFSNQFDYHFWQTAFDESFTTLPLARLKNQIRFEISPFCGYFLRHIYQENTFDLSSFNSLTQYESRNLSTRGNLDLRGQIQSTQSISANMYRFNLRTNSMMYFAVQRSWVANSINYSTEVFNKSIITQPILISEATSWSANGNIKFELTRLNSSIKFQSQLSNSEGFTQNSGELVAVEQNNFALGLSSSSPISDFFTGKTEISYFYNGMFINGRPTGYNQWKYGIGIDVQQNSWKFESLISLLDMKTLGSSQNIINLDCKVTYQGVKFYYYLDGGNLLNLYGFEMIQSQFQPQFLEVLEVQRIGGFLRLGIKGFF